MKILAVVLILIAGVGGFYGGTMYGKKENNQPSQKIIRPMDPSKDQPTRENGGVFNAEVVSVDNDVLTVKLQDGTSKIVLIPETTPIRTSKQLSFKDIKVGEMLIVTGYVNDESTIRARSIQVLEDGLSQQPAPDPSVPR